MTKQNTTTPISPVDKSASFSRENCKNAFSSFQKSHPAVLYILFFFLGLLFTFHSPWSLLPAIIFISVLDKQKSHIFIILFILPLPLFQSLFPSPPQQTMGEAQFHIQSIAKSKSHTISGWTYRGTLTNFTPKGGKKISTLRPCVVYSKEYLSPQSDYIISGTLSSKNQMHYILKTKTPWVPVKQHWNLLEIRMSAKERARQYIHKVILQNRASLFLTAIIIGELEDKEMMQQFGRLGLSHIMAISGFHFALLTLFLHLVLRLIFPYKIEAIILMGVLTIYFLFLGSSPSIFRAWVMAMLFFFGQVLERKGNGLNTLALAMGFALLYDPFSCFTLSFQLSFLATAGIFMLYAQMDHYLERLFFPKYSLTQALEHSKMWQTGYIFSSLLRKSLALSFAVNLAILPILFSRLHAFPLHGLFYNLFFPFLTTLSMMLFLISITLHMTIPPLGVYLHQINGWYTERILEITELSIIPQKTFYVETMPEWLIAIYLTALFLGSVLFQDKKKDDMEETNLM